MASVWDEAEDGIGEEVLKMSTEEIVQRTRLLDSEIKIMKSEVLRVTHELQAMKDKIKENSEKIKVNKTLPYLVSNVIELLDVDPNDQEEDGANIDLDSQRKGKCAVIKTSTRQTYFLPVIGLVDAEKLKPGDLVLFSFRFDSEKAGDREVQRTMLELLNQLDGFQPNTQVKVIAATNRVDILDPALLRSGRLDRKIEFPMPNEEARARIMQIHSRKMNVSPDVNYEELARCTDDFNGAQCKAVCVEAGMIALRHGATELTHEDYMEGILEVQAKKKANLQYYA
ncbi:26S proteasome regulatory subunit 6A [Sceloporus undulatus]|uniref:26S proteasome regulatory subunit 6A n=1 Tax=Sceloporus undulatus TaxID=8520 RepID=UPI001C4AD5B6|nr:26S proteasome regulatory subunit 6A [Sceloporus undulatus]